MLLGGAVPKEIAYTLNISYETVLYHQKKMYRKLEVHSINELLIKYSPASLKPSPESPRQESPRQETPVTANFSASQKPTGEALEKSPKKGNTLIKKKEFFLKTAVLTAIFMFIMFNCLHLYNIKGKMVVPNPIVITFTDDGPLGTDGARGWQYIVDRDLFFNNGEWKKSPYRLNKNERITAGDIYDISYIFISDTDIGYLEAGFFDSLAGGKEGYYWTLLSGSKKILNNIKAGVRYSVSFSLAITETATCDAGIANRFFLVAGPKTDNNPTLTFTRFDITKH